MRFSRSALLVVALLAATAPALAQPATGAAASADAEERRTRLFKEGKAAADAGQWAEAAAKFRQVVALRSAPKALIALGVAEERLGHLVEAHVMYRRAREEAADKALADELKTANAALEAIRARLPRVVFAPEGVLVGARLTLDGAPARAEEGFLYVNPGGHRLSASSPGKGTFEIEVSLIEGEQHEVEVVFGAGAAAAPSASATTTAPDTGPAARPPTGAVVIGGAGLVAAGIGAALWGLGSSQYAESDKQCPGPTCSKEVADAGNAGRSQMIVAAALFGIGGAALAGAGVWWVVSAASPKKPPTATFILTPRAGGLTITGRF